MGAKIVTKGDEGESVDIKDIIDQSTGKPIILHYIIYDFCNVDEKSYVSIDIEALDGKFQGFVGAVVMDLEAFSIKCTDKESETFIPREQHGSCEAWDSKIWVFGGKRTVKKETVVLGDIMEYDANKNTWKSISPSSGSKPQPRFGHVMMCYFQFFVIFGGESQSGKILGDLWVFDTIGEKWTFVLDTADSHELSHHGITGNIPSARAFASSVTIPELGVAYITGGLLGHGVA